MQEPKHPSSDKAARHEALKEIGDSFIRIFVALALLLFAVALLFRSEKNVHNKEAKKRPGEKKQPSKRREFFCFSLRSCAFA
jgi:hypothetical protein